MKLQVEGRLKRESAWEEIGETVVWRVLSFECSGTGGGH